MLPEAEFNPTAVAFALGEAAVNQAIDRLEHVRDFETRRREHMNAAEITSLNAQIALRMEKRDALRAEIRRTPRPDPTPQRSRAWYVTIAAALVIAAFAFARLTLRPFNLGWETWLYAVALAGVCAVATDEVLEKCRCHGLVTAAAVVSFGTGLIGLIIMAVVRGDIFALYLKNVLSSGVADAASVMASNDAAALHFYEGAVRKLQLFFGLLAVSMELTTGLAIYEARKIPVVASNALADLERRLRLVEDQMIELLYRVEFLKREAEIVANELMRNFYLGLIQGAARRGVTRVGPFVAALVAAFLLCHPAMAQPSVVTGLDQSLSSAAKNYDGSTEYAKDVDAAARLIETLPAGSRFRVMGITDQSFARPLVLLSGQIPKDRGPLEFIDQITVARKRFAVQMRQIGGTTAPKYAQTDVIGFLWVAGDILREAPVGHRVLVAFSDGRHSAPPPNIETPRLVPVTSALQLVERQHQIPDLRGVDVYFYGVHAAGKDMAYWQSLRSFWAQYFAKSGATLKCFSIMRDVPSFDRLP
ncbi:MAG: hypothetical protein ABSH47_18015 [Bryobacteraceae bacterium]|jgi:hypothetical protein